MILLSYKNDRSTHARAHLAAREQFYLHTMVNNKLNDASFFNTLKRWCHYMTINSAYNQFPLP